MIFLHAPATTLFYPIVFAISLILGQKPATYKPLFTDRHATEKAPFGFKSYATGDGREGNWKVREMKDSPSHNSVVIQTDGETTDNRFPVLIAVSGSYTDVDVSVNGKALSGKGDQGIGIVFRFRDARSYYICRANALEDNFRFYKIVNGQRLQIASADVKVATGKWHTIRAVAKADHINCYFDGVKLLDVHDQTYRNGKVGVWTKADSIIAFDDLKVRLP